MASVSYRHKHAFDYCIAHPRHTVNEQSELISRSFAARVIVRLSYYTHAMILFVTIICHAVLTTAPA